MLSNTYSMNNCIVNRLIISCAAVCALISCVNEEHGATYDKILSGEIDKTVNVLKNVSVPLGSLEKVVVGDILEITENTELLQLDNDGNISILITGEENKLSQSVTVPDFSFEDTYEGEIVEEYLGDFYFAYDPTLANGLDISQISVPKRFPDIPIVIQFEQEDIPSQIKDIRYAEVNATASVSLDVRINRDIPFSAYIAKGSEIVFPEWVVIGEVGGNMSANGHVVTLNEDVMVAVGTPDNPGKVTVISVPIIAVDATKLPEHQGLTADHKFVMKDDMIIKGSAYFTFDATSKVSGGMVEPILTSVVSFSELDIKSVEVLLGDDVEKDLVTGLSPIVIQDVPEILKDSDIVLDIDDVRLDVEFLNTSPFAGNIAVKVSTFANEQALSTFGIGPVAFDAGTAEIPAEMKWSFSEGKLPAPDGYVPYVIDGLTDIISKFPDQIEFKDFELSLEDEYVKVVPGETYNLSQSYSIYAPLAFGPDFTVPYTYEIKDLGLEFSGIGLKSALLDVDVENTIPLEFYAEVVAVDENGNVVDGIALIIQDDKVLKAGSLESPTNTHLTFELINEKEDISLYGLNIRFKATSDASLSGTPLNENHGIHFSNIILTLPDGITADLDEI